MAENTRSCASCGTANEEDARFCDGCGGTLARTCTACGVAARTTARFCKGCGAPFDVTAGGPAVAAAGPVRRTVTVMFADLAGSTTFEERVDAETARQVIGRYHDLLRSTAQHHRAGVTKYIGDGFMAVWGVPETGPRDAGHAVDAAVELQDRFVDLAARVTEAYGVELALRVAVNTGEVVVGEGDADLVGDALNVAARLEGVCPRGHVVVGEETWRSTRGQHRYDALGQVQVKGRTTPVAVFQWLARHAETSDAAPLVGRADEVRSLQAALENATVARAARMVTVVGDPGVGKTRLAAEFVTTHPGLRMIRTRCNVEETVALAPIVELLRSRDLDADIPVSTPERDRMLRDLNGLAAGVPGSVEETFWALRKFVEALATDGPLVIVLDDLQWADTLLLDFVEHLLEWVSEAPILVVALARPELRELRADFVTVSRWVAQAVHLAGLDSAATAELAAAVLGGARLPEDLLHRLPSSTGGNPLFVRELIGMLVDDEVLVREPSGWRLTIDVDAITIPPTIHALLASRLERLDAADRRVLEIASVLGTDFSLGAVSVLAGRDAAAIKPSLDRLRRLQFAQPSGAYVGDEPVWRFHHVLIRDVAYRRLLKSDRADLHERLADWVEAGGVTLASDPDEMVARHLESAHGYRLDLGTLDDRAEQLALRSARCYLASARRALDRDELASAGAQAARGAALATADDGLRAELLLVGCEAFLSAGDVISCAALVDELEHVAGETLAPWATCYRCQFVVYTDPERLLEVDALLQDAIDEFGRRNDAAGLAKAYRVRAGARARLGRIGEAEADLLEALIAARKSGDQRQITAALSAAPSAALWGPSPVPKAGGRCLDVVRMQRMATAAPSLEATSLRCLAVLELLRGRPDKARAMLSDARQIVADLGLRHGLMETELFAGIIESMVGHPVAAEPHFRAALRGLDALGVGADAGLAAALLARSVLVQGRIDDADSFATESERLAGRNLKTAVAWRAVRAEILCAQGRYDDAIALARDAVVVAAGTDLVLDHADACLALSRVLATAGDSHGADGARRDAEALYAAKQVVRQIGQSMAPAAPTVSAPPAAVTPTLKSRLSVTNQASETAQAIGQAMTARDIDAVVARFSDRWVYDDRRGLSGGPVVSGTALRTAIERILAQYSDFRGPTVAVRGERLTLGRSCWSDHDGNEAEYLHVYELDDDGRVGYEGRFDEDDFEGAYRELDRRYYAGEGAAFADGGAVATGWTIAVNQGDFGQVFGELSTPELQVENRSRSVFGDRSAGDLRASFEQLNAMVTSARTWFSAIRWLSPTYAVSRMEREAVGLDGEHYEWTRLAVTEARNGQVASVCTFDPDDEEEAFTYAEERVRATTSRLAVTNRASQTFDRVARAMASRNVDAAAAYYSDRFVFDDRRAWSGDPVEGKAAWRAAGERISTQYSNFEGRALAVRGERLALVRSLWSDDDGNETAYLHVYELSDDGLIGIEGRFDEDDFEGAYRELEKRYYAGEGAAFAEVGVMPTEWMIALNRLDFDRCFGELSDPQFHLGSRSRSVFGDRSAAEVRASFQELAAMVASARVWLSAICWLSPVVSVQLFEREAVGLDGEQYSWTRLMVSEGRDGLLTAMCDFDPDDEEAAFAYAEERVRATIRRLPVTNRASETSEGVARAMAAHDVDAVVAPYAERYLFDDRRAWGGDPIQGVAAWRATSERLLEQYSRFEWRTLAVRGERLTLVWIRFSDDGGNESAHLHVFELDDDGRIGYQGSFGEDDFEGAYRELETRYYAGEGAAFAESGVVATAWMMAMIRGDFDTAYDEITTPDFQVMSRSGSVFGDRSAAEHRASFKELDAMVASTRTWLSSICWLSPAVFVAHFEHEAVGLDGEQYAWSRFGASEIRDGRLASMCDFDVDAEDETFAYAEERIRATASRLPLTNRATRTWDSVGRALATHDLAAVLEHYTSKQFSYDDRRGFSGDPIEGVAAWRAAVERIFDQYFYFDGRMLAVRGEHLMLGRIRWSDEDGNETTQLVLHEVGDDGLIGYEGRFDEGDFEGAYRELEQRYYSGEGAAFAEGGEVTTDYFSAMNRGNFDKVFGELTAPEFGYEIRSRSVMGNRSAAEVRATGEELLAMVASAQTWLSAIYWLSSTCAVSRFEREAVGLDGEQYAWTRINVEEIRDGRAASICEFDIEDEEDAFAYAEELVAARPRRLAVANLASENERRWLQLAGRDESDSETAALLHEQLRVVDRRALSGAPYAGRKAAVLNFSRLLTDYPDITSVPLAVRGERLALVKWRCRSKDGYEATYLNVHEVSDVGQLVEQVRFDESDFESAYRELEQRYYAGEGAAFAAGGVVATEWIIALNRGDLNRIAHEIVTPDFRVTSRSLSAFGDRSAEEFLSGQGELAAMVTSAWSWLSAVRWLSPACCVARIEREAVGPEGEQYSWIWLYVSEVRDGLLASVCQFEVENEDEAFAYAAELVAAQPSRLTVVNRATEAERRVSDLLGRPEFDSAFLDFLHHQFRIIDRRAMHSAPFVARETALAAFHRLLADYPDIDIVPLAVRGDRLALLEWRCRTSGGYESAYLNVNEVDEFGKLVEQVRFDEDDFESAYRELEQRYYAGEGSGFASSGALLTEYVIAANRGDFDRLIELGSTDFRSTSRSRSVFGDRSAAELRSSLEELAAMVASQRTWHSLVSWLSPACCVVRMERKAIGLDGEEYCWTKLYVPEVRGRRFASLCEFELENEDAAFTYAAELAAGSS